jgi:large subunit ribosomal protein L30
MAETKKLRVTLVKSPIGYNKTQELTARAIGLRKLHHSVELEDNATNRGQINKIIHLVKVEEV